MAKQIEQSNMQKTKQSADKKHTYVAMKGVGERGKIK